MQKYLSLILTIVGALLFWAAWPVSSYTFLVFFAFVPLLFVEDRTASTRTLLKYTYLHMLLWNALTTWWIFNASAVGAAMAIFANSLIMCLPWLLLRITKRKFGLTYGYIAFIAFWISFEFIHHRWELSWPWLTLGNVFSMQPYWVQWYEATGTTGGSLWILLINVLSYHAIKQYQITGRTKKYFALIFCIILLLAAPIVFSKNILSNRQNEFTSVRNATKNVVIVQPNIDPYEEKFTAGTQEQQIQKLITLSESKIDTQTTLVIWPETAIAVGAWEDQILTNPYYQPIWSFLQRHPQLALLSGMDSYKKYGSDKKNASSTARFSEEDKFYYDAFNAAIMMRPDNTYQIYHKAKLVPGVETLPSFLLWLGKVFDNFGGTSGTLGRDKERMAIPDAQNYYVAAPVICYESIYSDYATGYLRKGANLLTILTNDGWWDDTPGYKQHLNYARLRAIETRRWVARSANTGVSCFIDPLGTIYQPQPWDTEAAIKMNIEPLQTQTFFVRHGDYLSRFFNVVSIIFLIILLSTWLKQRFAHH